jgi:hypothetical protein
MLLVDWWRARVVAKKLGLRDKGSVNQPHACGTIIRIGIAPHDLVMQYCHTCEIILPMEEEVRIQASDSPLTFGDITDC